MLADKDMGLDAVIELKVDEAALLRADRQARRGDDGSRRAARSAPTTIRKSFKTRLDAYRELTAPVSAYYARRGELQSGGRHGADRRRSARRSTIAIVASQRV